MRLSSQCSNAPTQFPASMSSVCVLSVIIYRNLFHSNLFHRGTAVRNVSDATPEGSPVNKCISNTTASLKIHGVRSRRTNWVLRSEVSEMYHNLLLFAFAQLDGSAESTNCKRFIF